MKQHAQRKHISPEQHQKLIRSVAGTMAIEGLTMSEASRRSLDSYASGQVSYQHLMKELKAKYQRTK